MAKKPKKLVDLEIEAVAGVDKAANRRTFLIVKRANDALTFRERITRLFKADTEAPKTFDIALAQSKIDDEWWRLNDALRMSVRSIVESNADNKADLVRESIQGYGEALVALIGDVAKGAGRDAAPVEQMQEALVAVGEAVEKGESKETVLRLVDDIEKAAQALHKRAEKGDGTVSNLDELLKGASQELQEAVKAAFAERDAKIETLEKQIGKSENAEPDAINKADLPEPIRKRLEDLEKQAREAEEIAKAEREARVKAEIHKRAESYANVGEVSKIAEAIYKAQGVSEEFAAELEGLFKSAHERIAKGELFKEVGHGGTGGSLSDDPASQFAELVEKAAEANNLSYGEAARKVAKEHPHLAAAYDSAVPVGKN